MDFEGTNHFQITECSMLDRTGLRLGTFSPNLGSHSFKYRFTLPHVYLLISSTLHDIRTEIFKVKGNKRDQERVKDRKEREQIRNE